MSHMLKAIHAQENRVAADQKARAIIEDLSGQQDEQGSRPLLEQSVHADADLLRLSRHPLGEIV